MKMNFFRSKLTAASVALLMGLYFTSLYYKEIKFTTIKGQQTSIVLPDGTKVQVNTDTKISYLPWQWLQNRKVILEGEAFFNVTKGNRFEVSTNGGSVAVLGTSFNVYSRNGDFRVSCFTGRVAVNFAFTSVCHILTKGQETMSYQGKIIDCPLVFNPLKTASWRIGQFFFTNEQLAKVFEELGRQFNVNIKTCDINKRFYTGFFSNKSLKEALELVCIPMGLTYGINNNNDVLITQSTN